MHHRSFFLEKGQTQSLIILHICIINNTPHTYMRILSELFNIYYMHIMCWFCNTYYGKYTKTDCYRTTWNTVLNKIDWQIQKCQQQNVTVKNRVSYLNWLCSEYPSNDRVTPGTFRLRKHHVTELEHVSYKNRWQNQKLTKNAMFKTVCPTWIDSTLYFSRFMSYRYNVKLFLIRCKQRVRTSYT